MSPLSLIFISSILLSGLGFICVRCFGKTHLWVSLALIVLLLGLPLGIYLPGISIVAESGSETSSNSPWVTLLGSLWGVGLLIGILKLSFDYYIYKRWAHSACEISDLKEQLNSVCKSAGVKTPPKVKVAGGITSPVIGGILRPTLFLPTNYQSWSQETLEMVLWHEVGHLKRKDLWKQLLGQLGSSLYWFNPLIRNLRKSLSSHCELACDAWVINHGISRKAYLNALCDVAEAATMGETKRFALSMADHVSLSERVKTLVDNPRQKSPVLVGLFLLIIASFGLMIVSLEPKMSNVNDQEVELRLTASPFPLD